MAKQEDAPAIYAEAKTGRYWIGGNTRNLPKYVKADNREALLEALNNLPDSRERFT